MYMVYKASILGRLCQQPRIPSIFFIKTGLHLPTKAVTYKLVISIYTLFFENFTYFRLVSKTHMDRDVCRNLYYPH